MGTLIPLAPGLAALARGDVASLATNLRTAFGATVIGLLVGTVSFGADDRPDRAATRISSRWSAPSTTPSTHEAQATQPPIEALA